MPNATKSAGFLVIRRDLDKVNYNVLRDLMRNLLNDTPEALAWVHQAISSRSKESALGKIASAVLWTDDVCPEGEPIGGEDPSSLIDEINAQGLPMFRGHDPGFPVGRTLAAKLFTSPGGVKFVAAILTLYEDQQWLSFSKLGINPSPSVSSPTELQILGDDCWMSFATDPREVDEQWVDEVLSDVPLRVERVELSQNAAEAQSELIRITLVFAALVWNPFVTTIATEAGKDVYAGIRQWLRKVWSELAKRRNPVTVVQSFQDGCEVSFLFRGKEVKQNYDAHDALPLAAAQAAKLIAGMKSNQLAPISLVYEFEEARWFPSYAILAGGQIVSDRNLLIAVEQLPKSLSIGIQKQAK